MEKSGTSTIVVFVHGLTGDAVATWGQFPNLVIEDAQIPASVMLWGYPTAILGVVPNVESAGAQLQTELRHRLDNYNRIVLVGHSLGGLVICQMIVTALRNGQRENIERIRHVVTYATPFDGALIADITALFHLGNEQMRDLGLTSETVTSLRKDWINRVYRPDIREGEERVKHRIPLTPVVGLEDGIVTKESAAAYFADPAPETVPGNHVTLKLPSVTTDLAYLVLKKVVLSLLP